MSYIGTGANRLSEIAARCNEPATNLSRPLKKLVDLGFLEKDVPFGVDEKNAKKSLYKIADPFMAFYYQFVVPNRSFIELDRRLPIEQALNAHFSEYVSMQWEKLCRDAVTGNIVNGVIYGKAKRWWGSVLNEDKKPEQVEFDVMAESLDKKYLLVGECKWTTQENSKQLTAELLRKANLLPFAKNYTIVPMSFLKNTPKEDNGDIKPRYIFMPLHNKKDHMDCVYYATDESALFRQYRLSDSTDISDINESHSVLLYLAEGCLQITLGNFTSRTIEHGMLVFLPKNIGFTGQTIGSSYFIASFFAGRLPLCNKYDLVDLQYQVRQRNGRHLPPPPDNFHN